MPTGYTAHIINGDITTGAEFLKLCTRAFGIAIDYKDEPLSVPTPINFEPDPYYKKAYDKAVEARNEARQMTFEEAKQELIKRYKEKVDCVKRYLEESMKEDEKYQKVRDEIERWIPPTCEHEKLKKFALEQLDVDKGMIEYCNNELNEELDVSDKKVWKCLNDLNEFCERDVEKAYQRWQKELKRTDEKNLWMKQFLDSLENM